MDKSKAARFYDPRCTLSSTCLEVGDYPSSDIYNSEALTVSTVWPAAQLREKRLRPIHIISMTFN